MAHNSRYLRKYRIEVKMITVNEKKYDFIIAPDSDRHAEYWIIGFENST